MAQFSFRIPNADYLGFPATTEAILDSACRAEELGFDAGHAARMREAGVADVFDDMTTLPEYLDNFSRG